ncbi:MAG TPA: FHA domain-containing protein [Blastocatellia bacterium]|nr:FHA domain-containing protein [Blastocatellia bacterium]
MIDETAADERTDTAIAERRDVIRITREEAQSKHVDDLLKRQMSLRGDPGITRDRGRRWYYQNWFVFTITAAIATFVAWAIFEPYFDDYEYTQGAIEELNLIEAMERPVEIESHPYYGEGWVKVNGHKIWLMKGAWSLSVDGRRGPLDPLDLHKEDKIGAYVKYKPMASQDIAIAVYVVPSPSEQKPSEAALTLEHRYTRNTLMSLLLGPLLGGLIGLAIGAVDGIICRLPRRALLSGFVGLIVGIVGSFISGILADIVYAPLTKFAYSQGSTVGFLIQIMGRSLAWGLAGLTMGLGQGIALRSKRLLTYGLLGGVIGGLMGGLLFDPIYTFVSGSGSPSAYLSRLICFVVIGVGVGAMIGLVELLARDAWLRMTAGPLVGKEFLVFKDIMNVGSSPRSDIYLFNDPLVLDHHATLRSIGDECEVESADKFQQVILNGRPLQRSRLRHGDEITIGRTSFVFEKRQG